MEEEVYIRCPEGVELVEDGWDTMVDCTELQKTIYGTKQAARQHWKVFMEKMERKGFQRTQADWCLVKRINQDGTVVICGYVDDCLITGERTAIDSAMMDIESMFETRRSWRLKEFRSGVGMLLFLVKHSRPDISNVVKELY
jgi:hypothetical protein